MHNIWIGVKSPEYKALKRFWYGFNAIPIQIVEVVKDAHSTLLGWMLMLLVLFNYALLQLIIQQQDDRIVWAVRNTTSDNVIRFCEPRDLPD